MRALVDHVTLAVARSRARDDDYLHRRDHLLAKVVAAPTRPARVQVNSTVGCSVSRRVRPSLRARDGHDPNSWLRLSCLSH